MPSLLTHLTAVERLSAHVNALPPEFVKALGEDLEYARFGAALPELPWFGGWKLGFEAWFHRGDPPRFTRSIIERNPVAFGLKAAELVSNGALVGTEAGLAFLAGYFSQVCVRRALEPTMKLLVLRHKKDGESDLSARLRIEWLQSLFWMQDLHGSSLIGTSAIRAKLQIRKASGPKGIGRGLFELVRVSSLESLGEAPSKLEVDQWMRGLYLFSLALGSPLGKLKGLPANGGMKELYRGPGVDVFAAIDAGLDHTREVLTLLAGMIRRNSFTARSRQRFFELCPEGSPSLASVTQAA